MKRKLTVIGDVHGDLRLLDVAEARVREGDFVVFVGDFLDSFEYSIDDQVEGLVRAIELQEQYDTVTVLKGNHEASYLGGKQCSGWKSMTQTLVDAVGHYRIESALEGWTFRNGFLISHAGVSAHYGLQHLMIPEDWDNVGQARGGRDDCGGLLWCDWNREFQPIDGVPQIVGHSRPKRKIEGNYNVEGTFITL